MSYGMDQEQVTKFIEELEKKRFTVKNDPDFKNKSKKYRKGIKEGIRISLKVFCQNVRWERDNDA